MEMSKYTISFCEGNTRHWVYTNRFETAKMLFLTYLAIDKHVEVYDNDTKEFVKI